ncbi:hypothetical protein J6590_082648 [Homalodisca vitripennis]|nr:hypothetical protein J6590_082648 [Homalodisca vitripennis]
MKWLSPSTSTISACPASSETVMPTVSKTHSLEDVVNDNHTTKLKLVIDGVHEEIIVRKLTSRIPILFQGAIYAINNQVINEDRVFSANSRAPLEYVLQSSADTSNNWSSFTRHGPHFNGHSQTVLSAKILSKIKSLDRELDETISDTVTGTATDAAEPLVGSPREEPPLPNDAPELTPVTLQFHTYADVVRNGNLRCRRALMIKRWPTTNDQRQASVNVGA